jgi:hypothetical protein
MKKYESALKKSREDFEESSDIFLLVKEKWLLEKKILEFESLDKIVFVCSNP